ncbi:hypothetical protein BJ322DRAFT_803520 [Thelephora terrestris]|uniref:Uncharacterized protein n=1 Tax=Thelephora terrestris TaxID=56493 RepID=A0A9P6L6N9_9AGAM|nr:hypothetical protein BJ322DRAFT_803520 [Thelephora terrestris]
MSTQLDIVYKLKEALETANPEVATPFMADDFTHRALPAQLGVPQRTKDQWKTHVVAINAGLKSLKVGTYLWSGPVHVQTSSCQLQFEVLDTIDNPGSVTLHVSHAPPYCRVTLSMARCAFDDGEQDISVEIVFVFKFTQDETGAPKLLSMLEFMDSLAMVKVAERQAKGEKV